MALLIANRLVTRVVAEARGVFSRLRRANLKARENRQKLEAELFRNRYPLSSTNDDDLQKKHFSVVVCASLGKGG